MVHTLVYMYNRLWLTKGEWTWGSLFTLMFSEYEMEVEFPCLPQISLPNMLLYKHFVVYHYVMWKTFTFYGGIAESRLLKSKYNLASLMYTYMYYKIVLNSDMVCEWPLNFKSCQHQHQKNQNVEFIRLHCPNHKINHLLWQVIMVHFEISILTKKLSCDRLKCWDLWLNNDNHSLIDKKKNLHCMFLQVM